MVNHWLLFVGWSALSAHEALKSSWTPHWGEYKMGFIQNSFISGVKIWWLPLMTSICLIQVMSAFNLITLKHNECIKHLFLEHVINILAFLCQVGFGKKSEAGCHVSTSQHVSLYMSLCFDKFSETPFLQCIKRHFIKRLACCKQTWSICLKGEAHVCSMFIWKQTIWQCRNATYYY